MNIRLAVREDIPQIEELLYQVHKVHSDGRPDLFKAGEKKYTTEELESLLKNSEKPIFVAVQDDIILGYAFCVFQHNGNNSMHSIKTLYIDDLCVSEKARGQKIGTQLYEYVLDFAKKSDCYNVTLNVWACNESAKSFYEKCGLSVQKYGMEKILEQQK